MAMPTVTAQLLPALLAPAPLGPNHSVPSNKAWNTWQIASAIVPSEDHPGTTDSVALRVLGSENVSFGDYPKFSNVSGSFEQAVASAQLRAQREGGVAQAVLQAGAGKYSLASLGWRYGDEPSEGETLAVGDVVRQRYTGLVAVVGADSWANFSTPAATSH